METSCKSVRDMPSKAAPRRSRTHAGMSLNSYAGFQLASQDKLAFVNAAGNAVMKVDNSTKINFGDKRNSIRVVSKQQFTVGSVWVSDIVHIPYGVRLLSLLYSHVSHLGSSSTVLSLARMVVVRYGLAPGRRNR